MHGSFVKHYCTVCGDWYFTDADNNKEAVSDYKISHLNAYNWQGHEAMIFSREGKTVKEINSNFSGSGWIAYEVTFNGTDYVFAQFKSGADVASMVVPEGGFLVVACGNNGIYNPGKGGEFLGYVCYPNFGLDAQWGVDASAQPQNLRHLLVMNPEATATNLALGKTYTTTAPNREDAWDDNGKKLTDGYKPVEASNDRYAAWKAGVDVEIVVDLGESVNVDTFKLFAASQSDWAIVAPAGLTVEYSTDGENFTKIDVAAVITNVANSGPWGKHELKVALDAAVSARYVKFTCEHGGDHVWISEVEVFNLK